MSNGDFYGFFEQVINLTKANSEFRKRLGVWHDPSNFVDPLNVTEAESLPYIIGVDNAYFYAMANATHPDRKKAIDLMPFAEIRLERHVISRPGGSCGENFNELATDWVVVFSDKARDATNAAIIADPLASMKDAFLWASKMLAEFETDNANQNHFFDSIEITRVSRTAPSKRGEVVDFWFSEFRFSTNGGR